MVDPGHGWEEAPVTGPGQLERPAPGGSPVGQAGIEEAPERPVAPGGVEVARHEDRQLLVPDCSGDVSHLLEPGLATAAEGGDDVHGVQPDGAPAGVDRGPEDDGPPVDLDHVLAGERPSGCQEGREGVVAADDHPVGQLIERSCSVEGLDDGGRGLLQEDQVGRPSPDLPGNAAGVPVAGVDVGVEQPDGPEAGDERRDRAPRRELRRGERHVGDDHHHRPGAQGPVPAQARGQRHRPGGEEEERRQDVQGDQGREGVPGHEPCRDDCQQRYDDEPAEGGAGPAGGGQDAGGGRSASTRSRVGTRKVT